MYSPEMDWSTSKAQHMCRFLSKEEWRQPLVKIIQCPTLKRHVIIIIITIIVIIIIQLLDQSVSVYSRHETYSYLGGCCCFVLLSAGSSASSGSSSSIDSLGVCKGSSSSSDSLGLGFIMRTSTKDVCRVEGQLLLCCCGRLWPLAILQDELIIASTEMGL